MYFWRREPLDAHPFEGPMSGEGETVSPSDRVLVCGWVAVMQSEEE